MQYMIHTNSVAEVIIWMILKLWVELVDGE